MTTTDILKQRELIEKLLSQEQLRGALTTLSPLVKELNVWALEEELSQIETSHSYMIHYLLEGMNDPQRHTLYHKLLYDTYTLSDKVAEALLEKNTNSLYFSRKRYLHTLSQSSIVASYKVLDEAIHNLSLSRLLAESNVREQQQLGFKGIIERELCELFVNLWATPNPTPKEVEVIDKLLADTQLHYVVASLMVSALTLGLLQCYNEQKLVWLLKSYYHTSPQVSQRALSGALIACYIYRERIALSKKITHQLDTLKEDALFCRDARHIFLQLIQTRETEKVSRKLTEEILPKMMKFSPALFQKIKEEESLTDITSIDRNPEWKELIDESGIERSMKELSDLQMEGADLFMGTFASFKGFPFFNEVANWFFPFTLDHTALNSLFSNEEGNKPRFLELLVQAGFLCNSDKYSFCLSLAQAPKSQRNMMLSQFHLEEDVIQELGESEAFQRDAKSRENMAKQYIQDLFRFFKLHPRKAEFNDPFQENLNLCQVEQLHSLFCSEESLRLVGEFYFRKEFYPEARDCFIELAEKLPFEAELHQKIGYCHQMCEEHAEALEAYLRADLIAPNSFWTMRHIATCYRHLKKSEMALDYYLKAEAIDPENLTIQMNIGHCYLEQKRYEEASRYYFKVEYLSSSSRKAWRPIAWCSFLTGKFEQAQRYYTQLLERKPNASDCMNGAHVEFALGNVKRAMELYMQSIQLEGDVERFREGFTQDIPDLISVGVAAQDIPILLDELLWSYQKERVGV